ncbi:MAG: bifunctional DNA-formamidopyrimidine glycosylase/DNA-(apurinic or apyrimidinic site) lyase [Acidimicrobiales bacterium]|jgi:formamidopyrimidine-DNA glycosylase
MPELPEVETIRRDLQGEVVGRKIKSVEVRNGRTVRRHPSAKHFRARLEGRTVTSIGRSGKFLLLGLDDGGTLVVHLGMSGQLQRAKSVKEPKAPHTHAVVTFTQGGQLRFVDPRTFGELFVSTPVEGGPAVPELAHLGFDPLEDVMSWEKFWVLLTSHKSGLKALLMDQEFVAGIGNMYADEILFAAGLRYDRLSNSLSSQEVRRLYRSMVETLAEAVKRRGSSLADEQYRDLFGEVGEYQGQHQAYDREGQACRRCRSTIIRVKSGGRSTYLCEHCQV